MGKDFLSYFFFILGYSSIPKYQKQNKKKLAMRYFVKISVDFKCKFADGLFAEHILSTDLNGT